MVTVIHKNGNNPKHTVVDLLKDGRYSDIDPQQLISPIISPRLTHFYSQLQILYNALNKKGYEPCIKELKQIEDSLNLELYLLRLEEDYKKILLKGSYEPESATENAHVVSKSARKVWYRMRTNFDEIEKIHQERVTYIRELGNRLAINQNIAGMTDLMLMVKDLAMGTDADNSDMDLAFSLNVENNAAARQVFINAVQPAIEELKMTRGYYPSKTAHIDWEGQIYATRWLLFMSDQSPEERIFRGFKTDTYTRNYIITTIFGIQEHNPISIPVIPPSKKEIFEKLMSRFNKTKFSL